MKRVFSLVLALLLCLVSSAFSEGYLQLNPGDPAVTSHYSVYVNGAAGSSGTGGPLFSFNSLCIDLYLTDSETDAYLLTAVCRDHIMHSSGLVHVSVLNDDGLLYFSTVSGLYLTGHWDPNGTDLWVEFSGRSFRLRPVPAFSVYSDWM